MRNLILDYDRVPWDDFTCIPTYFDNTLPEERPLLVLDDHDDIKRWFLHWNGAITKCNVDNDFATFSKHEKDDDDIPLVLQSKEKVHKALAEVCRRFSLLCF